MLHQVDEAMKAHNATQAGPINRHARMPNHPIIMLSSIQHGYYNNFIDNLRVRILAVKGQWERGSELGIIALQSFLQERCPVPADGDVGARGPLTCRIDDE